MRAACTGGSQCITITFMEWINEPPAWGQEKEYLWVETAGDTDYWQRTHYGFQRDNGHAYGRRITGDLVIAGRFRFSPVSLFDQCGLFLRSDAENWFKCSVEFEDSDESRLGSVNTASGWSDWASTVISSDIREIWYRLELKHGDITLSSSLDGEHYTQMRICRFHGTGELFAGIYGCSPQGEGFRFDVSELFITALS